MPPPDDKQGVFLDDWETASPSPAPAPDLTQWADYVEPEPADPGDAMIFSDEELAPGEDAGTREEVVAPPNDDWEAAVRTNGEAFVDWVKGRNAPLTSQEVIKRNLWMLTPDEGDDQMAAIADTIEIMEAHSRLTQQQRNDLTFEDYAKMTPSVKVLLNELEQRTEDPGPELLPMGPVGAEGDPVKPIRDGNHNQRVSTVIGNIGFDLIYEKDPVKTLQKMEWVRDLRKLERPAPKGFVAKTISDVSGFMTQQLQRVVDTGPVLAVGVALDYFFPNPTHAGTTLAFKLGRAKEMFEQEQGHQYLSLIEAGVDPNLAKWRSMPFAGFAAAVEFLISGQIMQTLGIEKKILKDALGKATAEFASTNMWKRVAANLYKAAVSANVEAFEEVLTEAGRGVNTAITYHIENALRGTGITQVQLKDVISQMQEAYTTSVLSFFIMQGGPGAVRAFIQNPNTGMGTNYDEAILALIKGETDLETWGDPTKAAQIYDRLQANPITIDDMREATEGPSGKITPIDERIQELGGGVEIEAGDRPTLHTGDFEDMVPTTAIEVGGKELQTGEHLVILRDRENFYAEVDGQPVGFVMPLSESEIDLSVAEEHQQKGIGTELMKEFRREYPDYETGGYTAAGEATERRALTELGQVEEAREDELAATPEPEVTLDEANEQFKSEITAESMRETVRQIAEMEEGDRPTGDTLLEGIVEKYGTADKKFAVPKRLINSLVKRAKNNPELFRRIAATAAGNEEALTELGREMTHGGARILTLEGATEKLKTILPGREITNQMVDTFAPLVRANAAVLKITPDQWVERFLDPAIATREPTASDTALYQFNKRHINYAAKNNYINDADLELSSQIMEGLEIDQEMNRLLWPRQTKERQRQGLAPPEGIFGTGWMQMNALTINRLLDDRPDFVEKIRELGERAGVDILDEDGHIAVPAIEAQTAEDGTPYFKGFTRSIGQEIIQRSTKMSHLRDGLVASLEGAYKAGDALPDQSFANAIFGKTAEQLKNAKPTHIAKALRSAQKTLAAINLSQQCPMFIIGGHGCYANACYITAMAKAGQNQPQYHRAMYTGEILQLSDDEVKMLNGVGGIRLNGSGDLSEMNVQELADVFKHAGMRGLKVKLITKQESTFKMLQQFQDPEWLRETGYSREDAGKISYAAANTPVQPSVDPWWFPIDIDNQPGSAASEYIQPYLNSLEQGDEGRTNDLRDQLLKFYEDTSRAVKILDDGTIVRKYGFSSEQLKDYAEKYPDVKQQPRAVVATPREIAEFALHNPDVIQTWMHSAFSGTKVWSDLEDGGKGRWLEEDEIGNHTLRVAVFKDEQGEWRIRGQSLEDQPGIFAKGTYEDIEEFIKENYNPKEQEQIFSTLDTQTKENAGALCCTEGASVDECNDCTSHCQAHTWIDTNDLSNAEGTGVYDLASESRLYSQDYRAAIDWENDSKALIHATEQTNFADFVHETGHLFRRTLEEDKLARAERYYGVKDGVWSREQEERFADSFATYLSEGKAPTQQLETVFESLKRWLSSLMDSLADSNIEMNPQLQEIFDDMFIATDAYTTEQAEADIRSEAGQYESFEEFSQSMDELAAEDLTTEERAETREMLEDLWEEQHPEEEAALTPKTDDEWVALMDRAALTQELSEIANLGNAKRPQGLTPFMWAAAMRASRTQSISDAQYKTISKVLRDNPRMWRSVFAGALGDVNEIREMQEVDRLEAAERSNPDRLADRVDKQIAEYGEDYLEEMDEGELEWYDAQSPERKAEIEKNVKKRVRMITGQIKVGEMIAEEDALAASWKKAEQASRKAMSEGRKIGAALEKMRARGIAEKQKAAAAQRDRVREIKDRLQKAVSAGRIAHRRQINEMGDRLKKVKLNKLRDKQRAEVEALLEAVDLVWRRQAAKQVRLEATRKYLKNNPDAELPDYVMDDLATLDKTPLGDMTVDQLSDIHDAVLHAVHISRQKDLIETRLGKIRDDRVRNESIREVTENATVKRPAVVIPKDPNALRDTKKTISEVLGVMQDHYDYIIERIGGGPQSTVMDVLYRQVKKGIIRQYSYRQNAFKEFDEHLADAGFDRDKKLGAWMAEEVPSGIEKFELTRGKRIALYLHTQNDDNLKSIMVRGIGFRDKENTEEIYKITEQELSAFMESLTPDELAFAEAVHQFYIKQGEDYQQTFRAKNGYLLETIENYYPKDVMPLSRYEGADLETAEMFERMKSQNYMRVGVSKGQLNKRQNVAVALYLNDVAFDLNKSIQRAGAYIGLELPVSNAAKMLYHPEFQTALVKSHGAATWKAIDKGLRDIAGEHASYDDFVNAAIKLRGRFATAMIGLNPGMILKQPLSYGVYAAYVKPKYLVKGAAYAAAHAKEVLGAHRMYSAEFVEREAVGPSQDVADIMKKRTSSRLTGGLKTAQEWVMGGVKFSDKVTVTAGMQGAVMQVLDEFDAGELSQSVKDALAMDNDDIASLSAEERMAKAYEFADWATERTQPMFSPEHLSSLQRGSPMTRMFTMFGTFTNQSLNIFRRTLTEGKRTGDYTPFVKTLVALTMNTAGIWGVNALKDKLEGDEPDSLIWTAIDTVAGMLFFLRDIERGIKTGIKYGRGARPGVIMGTSPLVRWMETLADGVAAGVMALDPKGKGKYKDELMLRFVDKMLDFVLTGAGLPYIPVRSTVMPIINKMEDR